MRLLVLIFLLFNFSDANEKYETKKVSCIQQSNYSGKTIDELKNILIEQAKRESVEELYGSLLVSKTTVENGKLVSDEIKQKVIGAVRVSGNPEFYNGQNFGEICAEVNSYITKDDLEKYSPKNVELNNYCFNDTTIATKDIKQKAKESAYKEIITKYKPSLKNIENEKAEQFVHEFKMSNENFDFNKGSFCFDATASILPYELEFDNTSISKENTISSTKQSINDFTFKKFIPYLQGNGDQFDPIKIEPVTQTVQINKNLDHTFLELNLEKESRFILNFGKIDSIRSYGIKLTDDKFNTIKSFDNSDSWMYKVLELPKGKYYLDIKMDENVTEFDLIFTDTKDYSHLKNLYNLDTVSGKFSVNFEENKINFVIFELSKNQKVIIDNTISKDFAPYEMYILDDQFERIKWVNPGIGNKANIDLPKGKYFLVIKSRKNINVFNIGFLDN